ncbi:MAG: signal peptidase I [Phycisphaeraceae bacterium]|nr:signal peptidase I [Phycisphaeraceae bacterium]MCB9847122.1 signal peptidase I [Phycisphaeraceae bacterium]
METPGTNPASAAPPAGKRRQQEESLRETLVSILIAFVLAFVFRSYVIEPFVIPTGSMAPTLLGAHMEFRSPYTGYTWKANPRDYIDRSQQKPFPLQGRRDENNAMGHIAATDPMSRLGLAQWNVPVHAGDRILVQKYLYAIRSPRRWDVVVFKNPEQPQQNYIKRLVGLPNEELWIADGDLFTRSAATGGAWQVARKPSRIQRSLWRTLYSSEWAPLADEHDGKEWKGPWVGQGMDTTGKSYRVKKPENPQGAALWWNAGQWPIDDDTPYNETALGVKSRFPVSDLRLRAVITPDDPAAFTATARLLTRGMEFQAVTGPDGVRIRQREAPTADDSARTNADELGWETIAGSDHPVFGDGESHRVEFWHVDQRLSVWIDGAEVCHAEYDWSPIERIERTTGIEVYRRGTAYESRESRNLSEPRVYLSPRVTWLFQGSGATLHRVGLDRDLYYQPGSGPMRATKPETVFTLGGDQFFTLGDNSPASADGRMWPNVDPWVAEEFDPAAGVVNRDLMMGRAFFVYFPAPLKALGKVPVPNFGEMRFIK